MRNINDIFNFCESNQIKLLFLSEFGSTLYGTNSESSDVDYKGVFLPNKEQLLLGNLQAFPAFSTGSSNSKNSAEDVDVELWSLHNFLNMVRKGETGAIDLLFASTNESSVIYTDPEFKTIINNANLLFNATEAKSFVGYAIGQANKYGIKGSRLNAIAKVYKFIQNLDPKYFVNVKEYFISDILDKLLNECEDGNFCKKIISEGPNKEPIEALQLLGSVHHSNTDLIEFKKRIETNYNRYGSRTKQAAEDNGLDYKALSHAVRAIFEIKELILTGKIQFPLKDAKLIKEIKYGKVSWDEIERLISEGVSEVDTLISDVNLNKIPSLTKYNKSFVESLILSYYN